MTIKLLDNLTNPDRDTKRKDFYLVILLTKFDKLAEKIEYLKVHCYKKERYIPQL